MKIAQISTCWARTPPTGGYGGIEWIASYLTERLVTMGHDVTLFSTSDSATKARLWSLYDTPRVLSDEVVHIDEIMHVGKAYEYILKSDFDVIHNHNCNMGPILLCASDTPCLTTFHNGLDPLALVLHKSLSKRHNYVSVSRRQRNIASDIQWMSTVYNGINVADFPFEAQKDDYFLFIGGINPSKGPHLAAQAAKALGLRLKIAGPIAPAGRAYYDQEIAPLVDGKRIEYVGEANFAQKVELYRRAAALLVPINWEEPFGLVMIEALACGTPVIAFPKGAAPEIILHGQVGFLVNDMLDMATAIKHIERISPHACREHVELHFSDQLMTERYLKLYERLINERR